MADLSAKYLGLGLNSPIIVGSSNKINSIEEIKELEKSFVGAIVLNSIFQEHILNNPEPSITEVPQKYSQEAIDYLTLISEAKKETSIPIIASFNCYSAGEWTNYLQNIQSAGADALEFNIFFSPNDKDFRADDYEKVFLEIVTHIAHEIKIPISIKLSPYYTNLLNVVDQLFYRGINGVVLFNDFFLPDIDLEELELIPAKNSNLYSNFNQTLRWTAIISASLPKIEISANIDTINCEHAIKLLLSGAHSIQIGAILKTKGLKHLKSFIENISSWMNNKGFEKIEHIQGQVNYNLIKDPFQFERNEFIKQFS